MANRGTLFLDEDCRTGYGAAGELLQLLQDGQFCRIGAQEDKPRRSAGSPATNATLTGDRGGHLSRRPVLWINVVDNATSPLAGPAGGYSELLGYFLEAHDAIV